MAKSLSQIVNDIRTYISKGKVKPARKTLDKAQKAGNKGPQLEEILFELLLAEGGGAEAAKQLKSIATKFETRLPAAIKHAETHLRASKQDHAVRDVLWELLLERQQFDVALRHVKELHRQNAVDGGTRAKSLLARKDPTGATGIYLLASIGALKTDRMKLADRLLANASGLKLLAGTVQALYDDGVQDGAVGDHQDGVEVLLAPGVA